MDSDSELIKDLKVVIISRSPCHRCKLQIFILDNNISYDLYEVNNPKSFSVVSVYNITKEEQVPTFILFYKEQEIFRSNEPISPKWAIHLANIIKNKEFA